jgi:hypothetical protein
MVGDAPAAQRNVGARTAGFTFAARRAEKLTERRGVPVAR